jgi:hypothetical protein
MAAWWHAATSVELEERHGAHTSPTGGLDARPARYIGSRDDGVSIAHCLTEFTDLAYRARE